MGINRILASVVQYNQYYPSGLPWASNSGDNPENQNHKFNGKEFIEMNNYDVTDMGWRTDYNAINRFTTIDRKCEKYPWQSPYCVANNNTVRFIDKNGENAVDPESGGTPATQTAKKTTEAQSTARRDVSEKIKPLKAPVALVQKTQAAALVKGAKLNQGTLSKVPSNLERYLNVVSSPQDQLLAKNPVIQVAAVAVAVKVAAPTIIATGNTTALTVEGSAALSFMTGTIEGVLKSGVIKSIGDTPPDLPYLFENPLHKVTSDATQGAIYFFNTSAK